MIDPNLEDALLDLVHDLGKYIHLPLAWLPADADDAAVREAAQTALFETRKCGNQVQTAASIWLAFTDEVGDALAAHPAWPALVATVTRALNWGDRLSDPLSRAQIQADMAAVSPAIRSLLEPTDG